MRRKSKCKICRRAGEKLFLKGEKCNSPKCPLVKRPYPPGFQGKNRRRRYLSEYGKQLREKQKLRNYYNLSEGKFKRYVRDALGQRGKVEDSQEYLIRKLEKRLDNVVFRLGFTFSRARARQLVNHGHFEVNGEKVNVPSYELEIGDKVSLRESSLQKANFDQLKVKLKDYQVPSWLKLDSGKMEGEVVGSPTREEVAPPAELSMIFAFYSR